MRTVWGVLVLVIVATAATVAIQVGIPSSATRLPGPVTVPTTATASGSPTVPPSGAGSDRTSSAGRPVDVVTPDRPVSSLPMPIGRDSHEAEQMKLAVQPATTTPSASPATDR